MTSTTTKPLAVLLLLLALGAGIAGMLLLRQHAPQFQATAAVRVVRDQTDLVQLGDRAPAGLDTAVFLQNEAELIGSDTILRKVIDRLELNREWGKRYLDGPMLKTGEAITILKARVQVSPEPGTALLRIRVTSDTGPEATKLADALATAYCEYRVERRQRRAQEQIQALAVPFQENEAQVRRAAELVEKARLALDPAVRDQNPPPLPQAEEETLRELRRELTRVTMIYLAQSNQLTFSRSLPPTELQKLEAQVERTRIGFTNAEAALQQAVRQQEALRAYWLARQELEKAELVFAPYQETVAASRRDLGTLETAPAVLAEPAGTATLLPAHRATAGKVCLLGAGVLFLAGIGCFLPLARKETAPDTSAR